jgi:hypothetical protein
LDDFLGVGGFFHNTDPPLVDLGEEFGLHRHFLGNVTTSEYRFEGLPTALYLHPKIKNGVNSCKLVLPLSNLLLEGTNVSVCSNSGKQQLIFFQPLKHLIHLIASKSAQDIFSLVGKELKFNIVPVNGQLLEFLVDCNLLICGVANIFNLLLVGKDFGL